MTKTSFGRHACGLVLIPILSTLAFASGCDGHGGDEDTAAATDTGSGTGTDDHADEADHAEEADDDSGTDDGVDTDGSADDASTESGSDDADGDSGSDDSGSDDTGTSDSIEIEGVWDEFFPPDGQIVHTITNTTWDQESMDFSVNLTLQSYDNATRTVIAYDGTAYSKLQWTWTDGDTNLWYCTAVFGAMTADEAEAGPDADDTDPANGGCGGFSWSALIPAE